MVDVAANTSVNRPKAVVLVTDTDGDTAEARAVVIVNAAGNSIGPAAGDGLAVQSAPSANSWSYAAATGGIASSTAGVTIKAAGAAAVRNYLRSLTVAHDTLGAVTEIVIRDGAGGTVLWRGKLQTAAQETGAYFFDPPLKGSAATLMEVALITSVTGGVFVNASGYTGS